MAKSLDPKAVALRLASRGSGAVDAFLDKLNRTPAVHACRWSRPPIFALDATMSRQPTGDPAQSLQSRMFDTASGLGGLDVQLVYFRGLGECRSSRFIANGVGLSDLMSKISVSGGNTQIGKVLKHVRGDLSKARRRAGLCGRRHGRERRRSLSITSELGLLGP